MINTLRITSVLATGLAIALISFSAVYGFKSDPQVDQLLETPDILEQLKSTQGTRHQQPDAEKSPLVIQAKNFANHLDPPPLERDPVTRSRSGSRTPSVTPQVVRAKFNVLSICYSAVDPNLSVALIKETGSDSRWVRLQDTIGRQIVTAIKEASLVLDNGQEEVPMTELPKTSLIVREGEEVTHPPRPISVSRAGSSRYGAPKPVAYRPIPSSSRRSALPTTPRPTRPPMDDKDTQEMQRIIEQLRDLNKRGAELSEEDQQKRKEIMERLTERMRAQRLSRRETQSLDTIGQRLDPNGTRRPGEDVDK